MNKDAIARRKYRVDSKRSSVTPSFESVLLGLFPKQVVSIVIERLRTNSAGTKLRGKWSNVGKWESCRTPMFRVH